MTKRMPIWSDGLASQARYPALKDDLEVDVAVVGGGMAGLHAAWSLRDSGLRVAVLEARRIGFQATGRSTAKVTSQHGLRYARLTRKFGRQHAGTYAAENQRAITTIAELCRQMPDHARFQASDAYILARDDTEKARVREETEAARDLGLPASMELPPSPPFAVQSALRFAGQGQFDPVAYLLGLAGLVSKRLPVFENSRVLSVEDGAPCILSVNGRTVRAAKVIVATQMPFPGEGKFFARAFPFAHPVAAAPLPDSVEIKGMFITAGTPSISLRTAHHDGRRFLVAAGPEFKPGEPQRQAEVVDWLLRFLRDQFGIPETTHLWTNEDFRPMDGLPFVGPASSGSVGLHVATGFDAWGITQSVVAGEVLAAGVQGLKHPASVVFDAGRLNLSAGGAKFLKGNAAAGIHMAKDRLLRAKAVRVSQIAPGGAGVVHHAGEQLAVIRSSDGGLSAVSAVCTHLGCIVDWNQVDRTWDCPCHGSRFDERGEVLAGPATQALPKRPAPMGNDEP